MKLTLWTSASLAVMQLAVATFSAEAFELSEILVNKYGASRAVVNASLEGADLQNLGAADFEKVRDVDTAIKTLAVAPATDEEIGIHAAVWGVRNDTTHAVQPNELAAMAALRPLGLEAIRENAGILDAYRNAAGGGNLTVAQKQTAITHFVRLGLPAEGLDDASETIAYLQTGLTPANNATVAHFTPIPEPTRQQVQAAAILRTVVGIDQPAPRFIEAFKKFLTTSDEKFLADVAAAATQAGGNFGPEDGTALLQARRNGPDVLFAIAGGHNAVAAAAAGHNDVAAAFVAAAVQNRLNAAKAFMAGKHQAFTTAEIDAWVAAGNAAGGTQDQHRAAVVTAATLGLDVGATPEFAEAVLAANRLNTANPGTVALDVPTLTAASNVIVHTGVTAATLTVEQIQASLKYETLRDQQPFDAAQLQAAVRMTDPAVNITPHSLDDVQAVAALLVAGPATNDATLRKQYGAYMFSPAAEQANIVAAIVAYEAGGVHDASPRAIQAWIEPSSALINQIKYRAAGSLRATGAAPAPTVPAAILAIGVIPGGKPDFVGLANNTQRDAVRAWIVNHYARGGATL